MIHVGNKHDLFISSAPRFMSVLAGLFWSKPLCLSDRHEARAINIVLRAISFPIAVVRATFSIEQAPLRTSFALVGKWKSRRYTA